MTDMLGQTESEGEHVILILKSFCTCKKKGWLKGRKATLLLFREYKMFNPR